MKKSSHHGGATEAIVGSMLWSAFGDALGFMTELVSKEGVVRRTGQETVSKTVPWKYRAGGRFGVIVDMPAGAYSDDTQLRLATARAISQGGAFDVVSFAKVELPVWVCYALGAGKGSKAAAANLARENVPWFANFFDNRGQRYVDGGGNGAAMRIQPHVWAAGPAAIEDTVLNVVRNAVTTHGHMRGILGAVLHALALKEAIVLGEAPPPHSWFEHLEWAADLQKILERDDYLAGMWMPEWERQSGAKFDILLRATLEEARGLLRLFSEVSRRGSIESYELFIRRAGGFEPRTRGSGIVSAVAASVLAYLFRDDPETGLAMSCNLLGTDTDTIASMAGALLGAGGHELKQRVQDRELLNREAVRLAGVAEGKTGREICGFSYPSLLEWKPPRSAAEAIGTQDDVPMLAGFGALRVARTSSGGGVPSSHDEILRWMETSFGQTLLVPSPARAPEMSGGQLPLVEGYTEPPSRKNRIPLRLPKENESQARGTARRGQPDLTLNELTQDAIRSGFDPARVGAGLMAAVDGDEGIERAIAFAAIVAKARLARRNSG